MRWRLGGLADKLSMMMFPLAQQAANFMQSPSVPSANVASSWAPVVLLILIGIGFAVGNIMLSVIIGPSRSGPGKETTYESGMMPIGDTHKRFNVRFYIVAMVFLVVDVEIVFFYPFATIFAPYVQHDHLAGTHDSAVMLGSVMLFVAILAIAYIYAWGKGIFRWD